MGISFYIVTHLSISIIALILGLLVFLKNKRNIVNITFFLLTLSIFFWSEFYVIWLLSKNEQSALFWARALNAASYLIPVFYLHWILSLLKLRKRAIVIIYYVLTGFFLAFSYSKLMVYGVKPVLNFPYFPQANWMYVLWLVIEWGVIILYTQSLLIKEIRKSKGNYRQQLLYVFIGSLIGFIGGSTNHLLMFGLDIIPPIGSPFVGLYPIFFSYAIVRHRLMDIKVVLRRSSVYLISLFSVFVPAVGVKIAFARWWPQTALWGDFLILIGALAIFKPLQEYYYRLANKYFFSSLYDSREVIAELSDRLRSILDINKIYRSIYKVLARAFRFQAFAFLAYNEKRKIYTVQYNRGFHIRGQKEFLGNDELHRLFIKKNEPIVVEEVKEMHYNKKTKNIIDLLTKFKVEVLSPLNIENRTIGILVFGPKQSKDMYNDEDLKVLRVISAQAAIAIENARLFTETKQFAEKLKKEIKTATADLRAANERLKQLDAAKSEFISIASHQLRTPLTIIKGYISMMLEGNFGKLTKKEMEPLKKVYLSNERLIRLVENLLNISRIESGRLQFNFKIIQIEGLVSDVVTEIFGNAKKKGIKLNLKMPHTPLPPVKADEEKIRQVVMNLIDNAIKYTDRGRIEVKVALVDGQVRVCVADTGMGIASKDLSNLFKKFSRGRGTFLVHTEGTGLGLFVARKMIEAHGGRIWAESKGKGQGAKFCFQLPAK
jgi:signal transduction histidine kinase